MLTSNDLETLSSTRTGLLVCCKVIQLHWLSFLGYHKSEGSAAFYSCQCYKRLSWNPRWRRQEGGWTLLSRRWHNEEYVSAQRNLVLHEIQPGCAVRSVSSISWRVLLRSRRLHNLAARNVRLTLGTALYDVLWSFFTVKKALNYLSDAVAAGSWHYFPSVYRML